MTITQLDESFCFLLNDIKSLFDAQSHFYPDSLTPMSKEKTRENKATGNPMCAREEKSVCVDLFCSPTFVFSLVLTGPFP